MTDDVDLDLFDQLAEDTDEGPEPGQLDWDQSPDYAPADSLPGSTVAGQ